VDVNDNSTRIAVGTIAPPGDPNVLLLDGDGRLLRQTAVGKRWIDQVVLEPKTGLVRAVCTMPAGTASDGAEVYTISPQEATVEPPTGFNGDQRPDVVLLAHGMEQARLALHLNTGRADLPCRDKPDAAFDLTFADEPARRHHLLRDSPTVGDFNGDGIDDLILGKAKTRSVFVLLGSPDGLSRSRSVRPKIEFLLHHETGLCLADFNTVGRADLAAFAYTEGTEPGFGYGPLGMFVRLQPTAGSR